MKGKPLATIFLVVFVDLLGFGIIIPVLPYYTKSFGASAMALGWLMMSYSAMQFLFSPFWGRLSDRHGRRPVLLTCILGIGASMLVLGFAESLAWLFAGRILAGFFGANISTASAYVADITSVENRAKGMGLIGAAFGLGFLFGPALGGFLSQWGYHMAASGAAILALLNFVFAFFVLKEPESSKSTRSAHRQKATASAWVETMACPQTALATLLFFFVTFGMAQLETSFALFALSRFGLSAYRAGMILALMALVMVVIQGGGIGRLARTFGEKRLVICGSFIMAASLVLAGFSFTVIFFVLSVVAYSVGYALANPSLLSLVSKGAGVKNQGAVMGVYQSAGSLGRILGPLLAGVLFDNSGIEFPFFSSAFFFVVVFVLASWLNSPSPPLKLRGGRGSY